MKNFEEKKQQIFKWLDKFEPGDRYNLEKNHKPETIKFIIETTKEYIDAHKFGNGIEFNTDYSVIKKQKLFIP